jgi:predicted DNA-binding protein (MmcQ/YjbR family)
MFCATDIIDFKLVNVKCEPEQAVLLREEYAEVMPGYHMSKKHWNSIQTNGKISDNQFKEWIKDSYDLVVSGLPKKVQKELEE